MVYNRFISSEIIAELDRGILPAADLRERLGVSASTFMRMVRRSWNGDLANWSRQGNAIRLASDVAKSGRFTVSAIQNKRIWRSSLCG